MHGNCHYTNRIDGFSQSFFADAKSFAPVLESPRLVEVEAARIGSFTMCVIIAHDVSFFYSLSPGPPPAISILKLRLYRRYIERISGHHVDIDGQNRPFVSHARVIVPQALIACGATI